MKEQAKPGYILVLTLLFMTLAIVMTTQIFNEGTIHAVFAQTIIDREKAKQIALGGVQIAMSMLETTTAKSEQSQEQLNEPQQLLKNILPGLNRWLSFDLKEDSEGLDGKLMMCISSEDGKININEIYDFQKKKFVGEDQAQGDMKKVMQTMFKNMKDWTGDKDLFPFFETYLKERGQPLYDVTELLALKEFATFKDSVFYEPPTKDEEKKRSIFLTDVFTLDSSHKQMQPWLLSDSWCAILHIPRAQDGQIKKREEEIKTWIKNVKQQTTWSTEWDSLLKPVYGKEFNSLPKDMNSLLNPQFESHTFSVLTYGKVGDIEQRLYTILKRQQQTQQKGSKARFVIKRIYWI